MHRIAFIRSSKVLRMVFLIADQRIPNSAKPNALCSICGIRVGESTVWTTMRET